MPYRIELMDMDPFTGPITRLLAPEVYVGHES